MQSIVLQTRALQTKMLITKYSVANRKHQLVVFDTMNVTMDYFEEIIVRWSVRLSVFCYLAFCLCRRHDSSESQSGVDRPAHPDQPTDSTPSNRMLLIWTVGLIFFLIHFVSSMGFAHDWSHQNAFDHTAQQTEEFTGWNWGGGIYFNYLFALVWSFDVLMWWKTGPSWLDNRGYQIGLHCFFAFIIINATIVFGPQWWWLAAGVFLLVYIANKIRSRSSHSSI